MKNIIEVEQNNNKSYYAADDAEQEARSLYTIFVKNPQLRIKLTDEEINTEIIDMNLTQTQSDLREIRAELIPQLPPNIRHDIRELKAMIENKLRRANHRQENIAQFEELMETEKRTGNMDHINAKHNPLLHSMLWFEMNDPYDTTRNHVKITVNKVIIT